MYIAIANAIYSSTLQGSGGGFPKACFGLDYNAITSDFTFTRNSFATRVNEFGLIETVTNLGSDLVQNGSFDELGSELITNGDFENGSTNWILGANTTIENGLAVVDSPTTPINALTQNNVLQASTNYKVSFEILDYVQGEVRLFNSFSDSTKYNANGIYEVYTTSFSNTNLRIYCKTGSILKIDNVSVKQVDPNDDWILSSATIEDSKLVINSVGGAMTYAFQSGLDLLANKTYEISFNATRVSGDTDLAFCSGPGNNVTGSPVISTSGLKSYNFTPTSTVTSFGIKRNSGGSGAVWEIDNIVVQEVIEDDIPRIDYTGSTFDVPVLGDEQVVNGDFENGDTDWTVGSGWDIADEKATSDGTASNLDQSGAFLSGKTYKVTYDVLDYVSGDIRFRFTGTSNENGTLRTANGTYTEYITLTNNQSVFRFPSSAFEGSIDNVSVKEVTAYTTTDKGAFLLEPISTNLIDYSGFQGGSGWTILGSSGAFVSGVAPDGDTSVYEITSTGQGKLQKGISGLAINTEYTFSFYAKQTSATTFVQSRVLSQTGGSGGSNLTQINYQDQLITDEWVRITQTFTTNDTLGNYIIYVSNALTSGESLQFFGAQLEATYATSYIPTSGTTVTRAQESCVDATPTINSEEGVLYAEIRKDVSQTTFRLISLNNAASNSDANSVAIGYANGGSNFYLRVKSPSGGFTSQNIPASNNEFHKIAIRYEQANIGIFIDGIKEVTYTGNYLFTQPLDNLSFDYNGNGGLPFYGRTKDLRVYCKALTDDELTELTTI